jgi:hypothetical protein
MVDLYPSENLNAWNLLSVRHFVYKLLFHVHLPRLVMAKAHMAFGVGERKMWQLWKDIRFKGEILRQKEL